MCVFDEAVMADRDEPGSKSPVKKGWSVRLGGSSGETRAAFRTFLGEVHGLVDMMRPPTIDPKGWRFTTGELRLEPKGYGYLVLHGVVELFLWTPHLEVLMRSLVADDPPTRTGLTFISDDWRDRGGEKRWRRYAPYRGGNELLAYGNRRREDLRSGAVVLLTEEEREAMLEAYAAQRAGLREDH